MLFMNTKSAYLILFRHLILSLVLTSSFAYLIIDTNWIVKPLTAQAETQSGHGGGGGTIGSDGTSVSSTVLYEDSDIFLLTNQERTRAGLSPLKLSPELSFAAFKHAHDLAEHDIGGHQGTDGSNVSRRIEREGYSWSSNGENVYWQQPFDSQASAVQWWMNSDGHRRNILNPNFKEIGLGKAYNSKTKKYYYVQVFATPISLSDSSDPFSSPYVSPSTPSQNRFIPELLRITNIERNKNGLSSLNLDASLNAAASQHAQDMAINNFFSHDGSDNSSAQQRIFRNGYRGGIGENILYDLNPLTEYEVIQRWMNSLDHRENILRSSFTDVGFGYSYNPQTGKHYFVQTFGNR